jgi:hypothetical protein
LNALLDAEAAKRSRPEAFRQMRENSGVFDPQVLEAVAACFDIYLEEQDVGAVPTSEVRVSELTVGALLVHDVMTSEGTLIVTGGTRVTPALLEKLRNFAELSGLVEPLVIRAG